MDANKNISAFFQAIHFDLNVNKSGTGSGTVTSSPPGIDCGLDCSESYIIGTAVTLTAIPDGGSTFTGWSGDPDCLDGSVSMDLPKTCTATFTLNVTPPAAFNKISPANGATGKPVNTSLTWGISASADEYEVCLDTTDNGACDTSWVSNGTATSVDLTYLNYGTTYYWQVRAVNPGGTTYANGSENTYYHFSTKPGFFSKQTPVNGALDREINLTLKWGSSVGAANYEYCLDTLNNSTCDTGWVNNRLATSVYMTGLSFDTTYYWHVRSVYNGGYQYSNGSASGYWSFTTKLARPGSFNKLSPANGITGRSTSLNLTWRTSSGVDYYEYCLDTSDNGICDTGWVSNGTATSVFLSGLSRGTTYYWHVRAVNAGGIRYSNGASTTFWNFTTKD